MLKCLNEQMTLMTFLVKCFCLTFSHSYGSCFLNARSSACISGKGETFRLLTVILDMKLEYDWDIWYPEIVGLFYFNNHTELAFDPLCFFLAVPRIESGIKDWLKKMRIKQNIELSATKLRYLLVEYKYEICQIVI